MFSVSKKSLLVAAVLACAGFVQTSFAQVTPVLRHYTEIPTNPDNGTYVEKTGKSPNVALGSDGVLEADFQNVDRSFEKSGGWMNLITKIRVQIGSNPIKITSDGEMVDLYGQSYIGLAIMEMPKNANKVTSMQVNCHVYTRPDLSKQTTTCYFNGFDSIAFTYPVTPR